MLFSAGFPAGVPEYLKDCREALKENYLSKSFRYEMSEKNVVPIQLICKNKVAEMRIVQYTLTGELYYLFCIIMRI